MTPTPNATNARSLNGYELASRLSFFIWASTPDDKLLALAETGTLTNNDVLATQTTRMLADPKASSLANDFARRWLNYDYERSTPDPTMFPNFSQALLESMRTETYIFTKELLSQNRPVSELLTANFSFLDNRLKSFYGLPPSDNPEFERVTWTPANHRQGLLSHAAVITSLSRAKESNPIRRGMWILDKLLCDLPPQPTAEDIAALSAIYIPNPQLLSTRQLIEVKTQEGRCNNCHKLISPWGFGWDNYDAIGQWRTEETRGASAPGPWPIDASGTLVSGERFDGPIEMGNVIAASNRLPMCVANHLLSYALGRRAIGLTPDGTLGSDYATISKIYENTASRGNRFQDMIKEIVMSDAFRKRSGANLVTGDSQ